MKRSEMLKIIEDAMKDCGLEKASRNEANHILFRIEQADMKPPIIMEKSFYIADNGEEIYATHEWESEND